MKLILTHKKQLRTAGDVSRFVRYCYGKTGERPVVPVEGSGTQAVAVTMAAS